MDLDERVKMRASFFALKHGWTLTRLIETALVAFMARPSKPEPEPRKKRQASLPLDEPTGGQVKDEPEKPRARAPIVHDEEV